MTRLSDPATWVSQHGDDLFRYVMLRLNDPAIAEDIVQETFLAALKARDSFAGHSSEKTWLIGILKHKMTDHFRKAKKEQPIEDITAAGDWMEHTFDAKGHWKAGLPQWKNPESSLEKQEFWKAFTHCISRLPGQLADLFILKEIRGIPSEEICKVLGITNTNNMWVMLSRSRRRLRDCLETRWFNSEQ